MAEAIGSFVWRFNHKTECWDKLVSTDAETYTAYQYDKATKDWTNVITLQKLHDSSILPATADEYAYWYCKEEIDRGAVVDHYNYIDEDTLINGAYDNSVPGTVWKWNGSGWETISEIDPSKKTYFISHGMNNTYQEGWIRNMASAIHAKENGAQIITVDWGDWSSNELIPAVSGAAKTEETSARVAIFLSQLAGTYQPSYTVSGLTGQTVKANLGMSNLNLIGHSHGGHVCAYLATYSTARPKTLVGLDISEEIVHKFHGGVDWNDSCAEKFYFYKSSPIYGDESLRGQYNFAVIDDTRVQITGKLADGINFGPGENGHGYSPIWYTLSLTEPNAAGHNIASAVYYSDMVNYFSGHEKGWIGVSDTTFKVECLDIGYDNGKEKIDGILDTIILL